METVDAGEFYYSLSKTVISRTIISSLKILMYNIKKSKEMIPMFTLLSSVHSGAIAVK